LLSHRWRSAERAHLTVRHPSSSFA